MNLDVNQSKQGASFLPVPTQSDEKFRRLNPEIFFLPSEDVLDFQGKPALPQGPALRPWKVVYQEWEEAFPFVTEQWEKYAGAVTDEVTAHFEQSVILKINDGVLHVFAKDHLHHFLTFQSDPSQFDPLYADSVVCAAVAKRLQASLPHTLKIRTRTTGSQSVSFLIFDQTESHFEQSYTALNLIFEDKSRGQIFFFSNGSEFALSRVRLELKEYAQVKSFFVCKGFAAEGREPSARGAARFVEYHSVLGENARLEESLILETKGVLRVSQKVQLMGRCAQYCGAHLTMGERCHVDYAPVFEHRAQDTQASLMSRAVLGKRGRGNFQGLIDIRDGGERADSAQLNKNILLHSTARADASPQLEVIPHDVMCRHGSATGELDEAQIYYLTCRGFSRDEARKILIASFAGEVLKTWDENSLGFALGEGMIHRGCEI